MIMEDKALLRRKFREIRGCVTDRSELSKKICQLLLESDFYKNADIVFTYWATDSEADTRMIIDKALSDNKRVALPRCSDRNGNMRFYYIDSADDVTEGMYGITEPAGNNEALDFTYKSLCIVPGLSFDAEGYRLGYGKGYYDRFLSSFIGITAGLCYDECLADRLPRNEFDKKTDYIITNTKIYDLR